jgi:hypothetical protein
MFPGIEMSVHVLRAIAVAILLASAFLWPDAGRAVIKTDLIPAPAPAPKTPPDSTLIFRTEIASCTATLVSPQVVLTAAQCLGTAAQSDVFTNFGTYKVKCDSHPDFKDNNTLDFALCKLDKEFPGTPAKLASNPHLIQEGLLIYLVGYGCRKDGGVDARFGELSSGIAQVVSLATDESDHFVHTVGSALCKGDAGGGSYYNADEGLVLIGVNSGSDLRVQSSIANTTISEFWTWARKWSSENGVAICSVDQPSSCEPAKVTTGEASDTDVRERLISGDPLLAFVTPLAGEVNELAMQALSRRQIVARAGETVETVVRLVCEGTPPNSFFEEFNKINRSRGIKLSTKLEQRDATITIPECPEASRIEWVEIKDETAYALYRSTSKGQWKDFERPKTDQDSPSGLKSRYFMEVFKSLNPNHDNMLAPPPGSVVAVPSGPLEPETVPAAATPGESGIFAVAAGESCKETSTRINYPFSQDAVLDSLIANKLAAAKTGKSGRNDPVRVLLADTGLGLTGRSDSNVLPNFFSESMFLPPAGATNFDQVARIIKPSFEGPEAPHGMQVATVMLGGPLFARFQAAAGRPRIKFIVKSIFAEAPAQTPKIAPKSGWETTVMNTIKQDKPEIVNLSIKAIGTQDRPKLRFLTEDKEEPLYVVAAGNDKSDLSKSYVYPAVYGGMKSRNIVTVGAINIKDTGEAEWAAFSNRNNELIDIAAPGCNVPVLTYDRATSRWTEIRVTGTSFAAPLVTFAAAVMKSEAAEDMNASDTKRRLLASADLHPAFDHLVKDGRILNLPKALSTHHDVIELKDGKLLFGNVSFSRGVTGLGDARIILATCVDESQKTQEMEFDTELLYKIHPFDTPSGTRAIVYYRGGIDQVFRRYECQIPPNQKIKMTAIDTTSDSLSLNQIADFVSRFRAFREREPD